MKFQISSLLMILALIHKINAQPWDPVDDCIFTCDYCFKGQVLLNCANECLSNENDMSSTWTTVCPYFGLLEFNKR